MYLTGISFAYKSIGKNENNDLLRNHMMNVYDITWMNSFDFPMLLAILYEMISS